VQVLASGLTLSGGRLEQLARTLSREERERAERLTTPLLRRRFVAARGLLRELLGELLGLPPQRVAISTGEQGKPFVGGGPAFNLAHSGDLAVYAFNQANEVGVDVERVRTLEQRDRTAAEVFTSAEQRALTQVAAEHRDRAFAEIWTRKEARLKATGVGLRLMNDEAYETSDWALASFEPAPGFVGAIAVSSS
jgi:4'-phosphopantetheinyl transferase